MKFFRVLLVLTFLVAVNASSKSLRPPCDCRYNAAGKFIKTLNYLVPYKEGRTCKNNKIVKVVLVKNLQYYCCKPALTTTTSTTTTTPPPPTKCEISCTKGLAKTDDGSCRCCEFVEYPRYTELKNQLDIVIADFKAAESVDDAIEAKIKAVEEKLQAINDYVLDNCGDPLTVALSASFEFIGKEIVALGVSVEAFKSSLTPNPLCDSKPDCPASQPIRKNTDCSCYCPVKCNISANFVTIKNKCECQYLERYRELREVMSRGQVIFYELSNTFFDKTIATVIEELEVALNLIYKEIGVFEYKWNSTTETEKQISIETLITRITSVIADANAFLTSGPCGKLCTRPQVNKASDCTCYTTTSITKFYEIVADFFKIESGFPYFYFHENSTIEEYFTSWAASIRSQAFSFYESVTESVFDDAGQAILLEKFSKDFNDFEAEWKAYTESLIVTTTKCSVTCSGDTVRNCGSCSCSPVSGWVELTTSILSGIPGIKSQINALTNLDDANKNTLLGNADQITNGINNLKTYVVDFCGNLDEAYVRLLTLELIGWNAKLKSDIEAIEDPSFVTLCTVSCPNSLWIYDASACKCTCNIKDCTVGIETFDPYNCICAKKSSCALTTDSCSGLTPLLDYSNCACKKHPSA